MAALTLNKFKAHSCATQVAQPRGYGLGPERNDPPIVLDHPKPIPKFLVNYNCNLTNFSLIGL